MAVLLIIISLSRIGKVIIGTEKEREGGDII